jgi:hypothetical protein
MSESELAVIKPEVCAYANCNFVFLLSLEKELVPVSNGSFQLILGLLVNSNRH